MRFDAATSRGCCKIDETKVFDYAIGPFDPGKSKLTVGGD
jgi:hypothetical protein